MSTEGWDIVEQAAELARRGEEFALATVVWRQAPLLGPDGRARDHHPRGPALRLHRRRLRRAGRAPRGRARDREPRAPAALPRDRGRARRPALPEGMLYIPMSCQSEGALQIYVEPVVPALDLVVVGGSPMTQHPGRARRRPSAGRAASIESDELLRRRRHRALDRGRRHPGPRRRGGRRARRLRRARRSSAWSPRASAGRRCWPTSPSAASPSTSSTASVRRSGSTSAGPATRRSRSPVLAELVAAPGGRRARPPDRPRLPPRSRRWSRSSTRCAA